MPVRVTREENALNQDHRTTLLIPSEPWLGAEMRHSLAMGAEARRINGPPLNRITPEACDSEFREISAGSAPMSGRTRQGQGACCATPGSAAR